MYSCRIPSAPISGLVWSEGNRGEAGEPRNSDKAPGKKHLKAPEIENFIMPEKGGGVLQPPPGDHQFPLVTFWTALFSRDAGQREAEALSTSASLHLHHHIKFNSVYFIQPNITNYTMQFTICTHATSLTFDLTSDQEKRAKNIRKKSCVGVVASAPPDVGWRTRSRASAPLGGASSHTEPPPPPPPHSTPFSSNSKQPFSSVASASCGTTVSQWAANVEVALVKRELYWDQLGWQKMDPNHFLQWPIVTLHPWL